MAAKILNNNFHTAAILIVALLGISLVANVTGLGIGFNQDNYRGKVGTPNAVSVCTDSDQGFGTAKQGICKNNRGTYKDSCASASASAVNEYSCLEYDCVS